MLVCKKKVIVSMNNKLLAMKQHMDYLFVGLQYFWLICVSVNE